MACAMTMNRNLPTITSSPASNNDGNGNGNSQRVVMMNGYNSVSPSVMSADAILMSPGGFHNNHRHHHPSERLMCSSGPTSRQKEGKSRSLEQSSIHSATHKVSSKGCSAGAGVPTSNKRSHSGRSHNHGATMNSPPRKPNRSTDHSYNNDYCYRDTDNNDDDDDDDDESSWTTSSTYRSSVLGDNPHIYVGGSRSIASSVTWDDVDYSSLNPLRWNTDHSDPSSKESKTIDDNNNNNNNNNNISSNNNNNNNHNNNNNATTALTTKNDSNHSDRQPDIPHRRNSRLSTANSVKQPSPAPQTQTQPQSQMGYTGQTTRGDHVPGRPQRRATASNAVNDSHDFDFDDDLEYVFDNDSNQRAFHFGHEIVVTDSASSLLDAPPHRPVRQMSMASSISMTSTTSSVAASIIQQRNQRLKRQMNRKKSKKSRPMDVLSETSDISLWVQALNTCQEEEEDEEDNDDDNDNDDSDDPTTSNKRSSCKAQAEDVDDSMSSKNGSIMTEEDFLQELREVGDIFRRMVILKDRKHSMTRKVYRQCFVGSQAVDQMVQAGWANSRDEAVELGRIFQTYLGLFHHVSVPPSSMPSSSSSSHRSSSKKHAKQLIKFKDKNIFYHFCPTEDSNDDEESRKRRTTSTAASKNMKKNRGKRSSWKRMLSWKQHHTIQEEEEDCE